MTKTIRIESIASQKNDEVAQQNRELLQKAGCSVVNMIGSPGSGKTALLETLAHRYGEKLGVITGDIQMSFDAERLNRAGAKALQIETGGACHLTAAMIARALTEVNPSDFELLVIENVGNLVCPSTYDLGEQVKMAVVSVPEGDEKPAKYPALFYRADAVVVTKVDLLPYVNFSVDRVEADCRKMNNKVHLFQTSTQTGAGIDELCSYLSGLPRREDGVRR